MTACPQALVNSKHGIGVVGLGKVMLVGNKKVGKY
jgi:hypothetical protein